MKTVNGVVSTFAFPIVFSALFCFFTGIPFLYFWKVVFTVLYDYVRTVISLITPENISEMQHWFRQMIFLTD